MDDNNKRHPNQRNDEPGVIDTTLTGNHPTGNYRQEDRPLADKAKEMKADGLVWIEEEDLAKQGMARKGDMKHAEAVPDHPHIGPLAGGRMGGGRS